MGGFSSLALPNPRRYQTRAFVRQQDIVCIQAKTGHRLRKKVLSDGTEIEETVPIDPEIDPLAKRMVEVVTRDGKDLLMANLLLQSRGLVEKARLRVKESLDEKAWNIVEKYQWGAGGVAALNPIPIVDLLAGSAISTKMVLDLADVYQQDIDLETASRWLSEMGKNLIGFLGATGATVAVSAIVSSIVKSVPFAGTVAGGVLQGAVQAVIIDHAEGRGFCAGGDIAFLRNSALNDGGVSGRKFFHDEYQLNHQLFTYEKPIVAFMDGITMGGGVGISQPAKFRVATENTRFAMPETGIGLFPDVGGGWYLSRLGGRIGQFLALTGARLDGAECLWTGLATHYVPSEQLEDIKARIIERPGRIAGILSEPVGTPPDARIAENADRIAKHFAADTVEEIVESLETADSDWAAKERATLGTKSPQTCKVALRQLATSADLTDFADNMRMEYRIASRVLTRPDFAEGVRAVIVDKTNDPKWDPPTPEGVSDELIESIFAPLPDNEEWKPL